MATELEKCEQQAQALPLQQRAILIKHLIEGLDDVDEHDLERFWIEECVRRFQEYKAGNITARSSSDVFNNVRSRLKEIR